ncbi:unnamed protein product [Protopolystoma xenopodis]|uniref:G-protein coupled receptors family 1 profile domain-containing protein n=1 Tax=Protopolystoma xenopodis TaxID=117903 RepID=A0A3S5AZL2_9PLAT|nr:unnamed protein product [Protopolystoma xenopodis]
MSATLLIEQKLLTPRPASGVASPGLRTPVIPSTRANDSLQGNDLLANQSGEPVSPGIWFLVLFFYPPITVLSAIGNMLVLIIVIRRPVLHTVTNLFIANLAASDLLISLIATPVTPIAMISETWMLPDAMCKLLPVTMALCVYVSTLTSTVIAVDRYLMIVHPFVPRMKSCLLAVIIAAVWLVAILFSIPSGLYRQVVTKLDGQLDCHEKWPNRSALKVTSPHVPSSLFHRHIVLLYGKR